MRLRVAGLNFTLLVVVTGEAGVFRIRLRVAYQTVLLAGAAMVQGEGVLLQQRGFPGLGSMAVLALQAKNTGVDLRFHMAPGAAGGEAFELLTHVARGAG